MILTNDREVYQRALELRNHGSAVASDERHSNRGYLLPEFVRAGYNFRMTDLQAAIGWEQLKKLDFILRRRREIAEYYDRLSERRMFPGAMDTHSSHMCAFWILRRTRRREAGGEMRSWSGWMAREWRPARELMRYISWIIIRKDLDTETKTCRPQTDAIR